MSALPPTRIVGAVLIGADDARTLAQAMELFSSILSRQGSKLTPRLEELGAALGIAAGTESDSDATPTITSLATVTMTAHDLAHDLLSASDAALQLGCTASNARALARRGMLDAHHIGGRWIFSAESVRKRAARQ